MLEQQQRHPVLELLREDGAVTEELVANLLSWHHNGFSVNNSVRIAADDRESRRQLARYMVRNPFALEKKSVKCKYSEPLTKLALSPARGRRPGRGGSN